MVKALKTAVKLLPKLSKTVLQYFLCVCLLQDEYLHIPKQQKSLLTVLSVK